MRREIATTLKIIGICFAIPWVFICGISAAAQEPKPKSGKVIGELKSQKNTPDGKNTFIEVLAPGEEKPRKYHVLYDPKIKGPIDNVLHFASPASPVDYLNYPIQTLKVGSLGTHVTRLPAVALRRGLDGYATVVRPRGCVDLPSSC